MTAISNRILETVEEIEASGQSAGSLEVRDDHQIAPQSKLRQWKKIAPVIAIATLLPFAEEYPDYEMRTQVAISNRDVIFDSAQAAESQDSSGVFVIPRKRPILFEMKNASIRVIGTRRPFIVASPYAEDD
jgi:hypothetical protein